MVGWGAVETKEEAERVFTFLHVNGGLLFRRRIGRGCVESRWRLLIGQVRASD